ncbi:hypothetical protein [Sphingomonas colocasiae]|uniref:Uncharacterized protein n=1 Tax=Sphingomonas colocasiae TaxID=1848973 RepID=A0ABS7Q0P2_9SPHN|nr:hypothetical protein [Sphingomonas colocasiae]MBY8826127.1 hypothetical protein [Sphingomonas colocasiae]
MKLIPILPPINDLGLDSTTVAEGEMASAFNPAWNYTAGEGASVGVYGGVITTYISLHDDNLGNYPATSPGSWKKTAWTYMALTPDVLPYFVFKAGDRVLDIVNHRTMEALQGTQAVVTISIGTPAVVSWVGHDLPADTPIVFESTGIMPAGLDELVVYYVKSPLANSFNLAAAPGGAALNTTGSGVTDTITATANPTFNKPLSDIDFWLDREPSNRWAMLDNSPGTQTTAPETMSYRLIFGRSFDTLAFLNVDAATISISLIAEQLEDPIERSFIMTDNSKVFDLWDYYYEPIVRKTDLIVDDIEQYNYDEVWVTVAAPGGMAAVGALVVGQSQTVGLTEQGLSLGIQDYSRKARDDFGNFAVVERGYSRRGSFKVYLDNVEVDRVHHMLAQYRATAALWKPDGGFSSSVIFGFYKDFNIEVAYPTLSVCTLEIEGLT